MLPYVGIHNFSYDNIIKTNYGCIMYISNEINTKKLLYDFKKIGKINKYLTSKFGTLNKLLLISGY